MIVRQQSNVVGGQANSWLFGLGAASQDTGNCREPCEGGQLPAPACDQPPWGQAYCNALDPKLLELNTANEPLMAPTVPAPWWHFVSETVGLDR